MVIFPGGGFEGPNWVESSDADSISGSRKAHWLNGSLAQ